MQLPEICIKRPVFAIVINVLLVIVGLVGFERLSVRQLPVTEQFVANIETVYLGASADLIEEEITTRIENRLTGVEGIDAILSNSYEGASDITIRFQPNYDIALYDFVGITVIGVPYIPVVADYITQLKNNKHIPTVLLGGQPIAHLESDLFESIFGEGVIQIKNDADLTKALGNKKIQLASPFEVSLHKAFDLIPDNYLKLYLAKEMTLFISQGCHFRCAFCAASKGVREQFRSIDLFRDDLVYLVKKAKIFGYKKLEFYATSLDFFQNPKKIVEYLKVIYSIKVQYGIDIHVRCLACMPSFLKAHSVIPNLSQICNDGGLWSVGFGVDGTDASMSCGSSP